MSRRRQLSRGYVWGCMSNTEPPEDEDVVFDADDFVIPDEPDYAYLADRAADLYERDLDRRASQ